MSLRVKVASASLCLICYPSEKRRVLGGGGLSELKKGMWRKKRKINISVLGACMVGELLRGKAKNIKEKKLHKTPDC